MNYATQGDSRRGRRSFLPAPTKSSNQPTPPQSGLPRPSLRAPSSYNSSSNTHNSPPSPQPPPPPVLTSTPVSAKHRSRDQQDVYQRDGHHQPDRRDPIVVNDRQEPRYHTADHDRQAPTESRERRDPYRIVRDVYNARPRDQRDLTYHQDSRDNFPGDNYQRDNYQRDYQKIDRDQINFQGYPDSSENRNLKHQYAPKQHRPTQNYYDPRKIYQRESGVSDQIDSRYQQYHRNDQSVVEQTNTNYRHDSNPNSNQRGLQRSPRERYPPEPAYQRQQPELQGQGLGQSSEPRRDLRDQRSRIVRENRSQSADSQVKEDKPVFGKGLRVGAKVKIGGIKPGILRYLGTTHLAPGIFCGIELHTPDGSHDGQVNGHRYFNCRPKCGIFAPKEKVCLDVSETESYSSNESLTDRSSERFKEYAEGELEAIIVSPESSFHEGLQGDQGLRGNQPPPKQSLFGGLRHATKQFLSTTFDIGEQSSVDPPFLDHQQRRYTSSSSPTGKSGKLSPYGNSHYTNSRGYEDISNVHNIEDPYSPKGKECRLNETFDLDTAYYSPSSPQHRHTHRASDEDLHLCDAVRRGLASQGYSKQTNQYFDYPCDQDREYRGPVIEDRFVSENQTRERGMDRKYSDPKFIKDIAKCMLVQDDSYDNWPTNPRSRSNYIGERSNNVDGRDQSMLSTSVSSGDDSVFKSYVISRGVHEHGTDRSDRTYTPDIMSTTQTISDHDRSGEVTEQTDHCLDGQYTDTSGQSESGESSSSGYAPDTDTVLTNGDPQEEFIDQLGVTQPTSFALDGEVESDDNDSSDASPKQKVKEPEAIVSDVTEAPPKESQTTPTLPLDEESSSDPSVDDRIEADRVHGPQEESEVKAKPEDGKSQVSVSPKSDGGAVDGDKNGSTDSSPTIDDTSRTSEVSNRENPDTKDGDAETKKSKTRKPFTMTKKKMEVIDHKLPNTKVTSRLADYIKTPPPAKPRDDNKTKEEKKNAKNISKNNTPPIVDKKEKIKFEKPKPVPVKRNPPKSKWGDIMSNINTKKEEPKPKTEVKSSLAVYLSAPVEQNQVPKIPYVKKKSKIKELPPPPPKIDLSKIKSKLGVPTAASVSKVREQNLTKTRDQSPATSTRGGARQSRDNSPSVSNKSNKKRPSDGSIVLIRQPSAVSSTAVSSTAVSSTRSSTRSSRTDLANLDTREQNIKGQNGHMAIEEAIQALYGAGDKTDGGVSKRGSLDLDRKSRRSSTNSKADPVEKSKDIERGRRLNGKGSATLNNTRRRPTANGVARGSGVTSSHAPEVTRLENLCEARTKELGQARMQLKATNQAFDAMAAVVNYCCFELDAFECPKLAARLETIQRQLTDCLSQIADLTNEKEGLHKNITEITQEREQAAKLAGDLQQKVKTDHEGHLQSQREMEETHNAALTAQRDELAAQHKEALKKLDEYQHKQIEQHKQTFERKIADLDNENKMTINGLKISQLEEIQELRNKHDLQMEELHKQHRNKLEDITHRFESIKLTLSEKVESLRGECDDLRHRARASEEALHRDADVKVQMALAPYLSLPNEIDSLKTVIEMRTQEINKLRTKNMDLYKQLEELPIAKDKICSLKQKVENLEAIITMKTDHEKQLHEKCQILMRKYDKESRANKRLSMNYEEVMWRMSQSSDFGSSESLTKRQVSHSPPRSDTSSPDLRRRHLSPSNGDVTMRPKRRNHDDDNKLRTRSATFVLEKNESLIDARSPSSSPRLKQKRWKTTSTSEEPGHENRLIVQPEVRMCNSTGPNMLAGHLGETDEAYLKNATESDHDSLRNSFEPTGDMISSYAKSISGVSDSGVYSGTYDSMIKSDMLNSSVISTDSEFVASTNVSMMLDSTNEDVEDENVRRDSKLGQDHTVLAEASSSVDQDTSLENKTYEFNISIPSDSRDNVFEDTESVSGSASMGSSSVSLDGISADNSHLNSLCEDISSHDITRDTAVSSPVIGSEFSRDESSDSLSGMPRSETIIEKRLDQASVQ